MITSEEAKKISRKNRKREYRRLYKLIKGKAEEAILSSTENDCYIEVKPELRFLTWLVMKKLERKGYVCELKRCKWSTLFLNDILSINWEA